MRAGPSAEQPDWLASVDELLAQPGAAKVSVLQVPRAAVLAAVGFVTGWLRR